MTPQEFISRWQSNTSSERSGAQSHFNDLCDLIGEPRPNDDPLTQDDYCFERGAKRTGAGRGWADVWKRGHFAWEYKKPHSNLDAALKQLMTYALALDNPPLLVVSDRLNIQIHTHFTGTPSDVHTIAIADIGTPANVEKLRWLFKNADRFKPTVTTAGLTQEAAALFGDLAQSLQKRGHDPRETAHFLNKVLFCLFAEDAFAPGQEPLLPGQLFTKILQNGLKDTGRFERQVSALFSAMSNRNGVFGEHMIEWFNGSMFDDDIVISLEREDIVKLVSVAKLDWSQIEPSIFGTLFERGLNPKKRSQLGAHYTDPQSIMRIVNPVIREPLLAEWDIEKQRIAKLMEVVHDLATSRKSTDKAKATKAFNDAYRVYVTFLERLKNFKVLDPACGSGNFLYMALQTLKDIELRVHLDAEALSLERTLPQVGPEAVLGIELDPYAAELARVTVWIGEIQWMLKHGFSPTRDPILKTLNQIECRDALLSQKGASFSEAEWPAVDVIIGNPPFLGGSRKRSELGDAIFEALKLIYKDRVPAGADLVCYWFDKARIAMESKRVRRIGLVSTNSIRGGANRAVLDAMSPTACIFDAWADQPWVNEGAAVRVSIVCIAHGETGGKKLDGCPVSEIYSDLTGSVSGAIETVDLTKAEKIKENAHCCYLGMKKGGAFDISRELAFDLISKPNPHGKSNKLVLRKWVNGTDIVRRPLNKWIIDFSDFPNEDQAELFESPFEYVKTHVLPTRSVNRRDARRKNWWLFSEIMPTLRKGMDRLQRVIVTPRVSKYRLFTFRQCPLIPDDGVAVILRSDYEIFGILQSRFHELWSLRMCTWLGKGNDPRYTPTTCFETFPFPEGLSPAVDAADYFNPARNDISKAAAQLEERRSTWLNPPEWTLNNGNEPDRVGQEVLPRPEFINVLKKRTLTNLYNQRAAGDVSWLDSLHNALDVAVASAYGWTDYTPDMTDDEILRRLFAHNNQRAAAGTRRA